MRAPARARAGFRGEAVFIVCSFPFNTLPKTAIPVPPGKGRYDFEYVNCKKHIYIKEKLSM
jgi:hypothetical protein